MEHTSSSNHDAIAELIPAYTLEALTPAEQTRVEAHLANCSDCRALLAEYQAVAEGLLYTALAVAAPVRLKADLLRRLEEARPQEAVALPRSHLRTWLAMLFSPPARPALALASLLVLVLIASNLYWLSTAYQLRARQASLAHELEEVKLDEEILYDAMRILATGGRTIVLRGDAPAPEAVGTLTLSPDQAEAVLIVDGLLPPPMGKIYQLWLIRDGQRESGGLFTVDAGNTRGVLAVRAPRPLANYQAVGVTIEPAGGSSGPTSPRVIGGRLP